MAVCPVCRERYDVDGQHRCPGLQPAVGDRDPAALKAKAVQPHNEFSREITIPQDLTALARASITGEEPQVGRFAEDPPPPAPAQAPTPPQDDDAEEGVTVTEVDFVGALGGAPVDARDDPAPPPSDATVPAGELWWEEADTDDGTDPATNAAPRDPHGSRPLPLPLPPSPRTARSGTGGDRSEDKTLRLKVLIPPEAIAPPAHGEAGETPPEDSELTEDDATVEYHGSQRPLSDRAGTIDDGAGELAFDDDKTIDNRAASPPVGNDDDRADYTTVVKRPRGRGLPVAVALLAGIAAVGAWLVLRPSATVAPPHAAQAPAAASHRPAPIPAGAERPPSKAATPHVDAGASVPGPAAAADPDARAPATTQPQPAHAARPAPRAGTRGRRPRASAPPAPTTADAPKAADVPEVADEPKAAHDLTGTATPAPKPNDNKAETIDPFE